MSVEIEEIMLKVAAKENDAVTRLTSLIQRYKVEEIPTEIAADIAENLSLIIDNVENVSRNPEMQTLLLDFAEIGVNCMLLRDVLSAICRQVYESYPDPAGLIRVLGIFDEKIDLRQVRSRWNVFSLLKEDAIVWHSSYGLGSITEIDEFSDLVYVRFNRKQNFSLVQAVTTLAIAKSGTLTASLTGDKNFKFKCDKTAAEIDTIISNDFIPKLENVDQIVEAIFVPKWMHLKNYNEWRSGRTKNRNQSGTAEPLKRDWSNSRSLEELFHNLQDVKSIKVTDIEAEHLSKIFVTGATKPLAKLFFARDLAILWGLCDNTEWLVNLIHALPSESLVWNNQENFVEITAKLSAKQHPGWFSATYIAKGGDWLIDQVLALPFRHLMNALKILDSTDKTLDDVFEIALQKLKKGLATADCTIWIWRQQREEAKSIFANPNVVCRVLNQRVRGDYLKAQKDLRKLLLDDQDFQRALMENGTTSGISTFVKVVKTTPILNKGEQQSLLVKVIRIYPQAQEIVEDRKKVITRRAMPKFTSYRSVEEKRLELEKITNEKIPKNSAAIAHARSYGDLRENAEYKAAKEQQRLLMLRRDELERGLKEVIATDFSDVCVFDTIIPGCTIELVIAGKTRETYHVLGLWDSDPGKKILSYDTPLGRVLFEKNVGDALVTPQGEEATVKSIRKLPDEILDWVKTPEESLV